MRKIYENTMNLYAGMNRKGRIVGVVNIDGIPKNKTLKVMCDGVEVGFMSGDVLLLEVGKDEADTEN